MAIYDKFRETGCVTDHHESDLYVLDTSQAREIAAEHKARFTAFIADDDGKRWLEFPFEYMPFWRRKVRAS